MQPFARTASEVIRELESDRITGLTQEEAMTRLLSDGENKLVENKKKSIFIKFLEQFKDVMILILLAAAAVSFGIACTEGELREFFEPLLILLIVVINAVMGTAQESKAEKALEALKSMSAPHARVIRSGSEEIIDAAKLVKGDIILLEAGDFVPADSRLIEASSLKSEESALTGESIPSEKSAETIISEDAPLGERKNVLYSGCSVTYGTAKAIVTAVGMNTEIGKIAGMLKNEEETETPLQRKLAQLGKYLGITALAACAVIFVIGLVSGIGILEIFMTSVSLAVSAIPEGLPAIITIILAIGVQRLVKKNAIIRKLPAVETLGSASVICSDKTGTLTQNRMTLLKAYTDANRVVEDISDNNGAEVKRLLEYATLCCNGSISFADSEVKHIGDPTETSIIYAAYRNGIMQKELNRRNIRLGEIPFDSDRKLMTSVNLVNSKITVIVKGAFDELEKRCVYGDLEKARKVNDKLSSSALRIISVAYKTVDTLSVTLIPEKIESGLTFLGLVGMIDPPRPEAKEAVELCRKAGIKPVMITGDHVVTAAAIARELGILTDGDVAITGAELHKMSAEELDGKLRNISVFARVSPEDKIRIVKAWQKKNEIVSMTGDGVNDAPALKAADIGCAMGITGTDVAKSAADMTLTDDNFATIVHAVKEGRGIYANIRKVVGFLLGTNIGEVLTVFTAMLLWRKTPLVSMQLLMINLVTDGFPAVALGMEDVESDIMESRPRPKNEGIFANGLGIKVILQGCMIAMLTLGAFAYGTNAAGSLQGGQTMAFMVLALSQIVQAYNMRSDKSLFIIRPFSNRKLNWAAVASVALIAAVLFTPAAEAFGLISLSPADYLIGLGLSFLPLAIMEIAKLMLNKKKNNTRKSRNRIRNIFKK